MSQLAQTFPDEPAPLTLAPPPENAWQWWQNARKGNFGRFDPFAPQQGLYRYRPRKSDRGKPAKIWFDDEAECWFAKVAGALVEDVSGAWRYSHLNPISKELFDSVSAGGAWPDEIDDVPPTQEQPPGIGHNSRRPEDEIRDEIETADASFAAWLKEIGGKILSEEQDAKADAYAKRFREFEAKIKTAHQTAKAPILEQSRAIDAAWITGDHSVKSYAEACKRRVLSTAEPYRIERKRLADEAAKRAREEAELKRKQDDEARAKAAEAGRTFVPAAPTARTPYAPKKAAGVVEVKVCVIDDLPAVAGYIAAMSLDADGRHPRADFVDVCRSIAAQILKAGALVPGARIVTEHKAR